MKLRDELLPPKIRTKLLKELSDLASKLDGSKCEGSEPLVERFNQLANTNLKFSAFQGIYGAEEHEDWVRRILYTKALSPHSDLTRAEMVEIVTRVTDVAKHHEFFLLLFEANCKHPSKSDLIFYPDLVPELPQDRDPTEEEIADLAMRGVTDSLVPSP